MEDKLPDLRRSPRLIELARLQELGTTENVEEKQYHSKLDAQQTTAQLELRRMLAKAKRDSMNQNEREAQLSSRRTTYHMQRIRAIEKRNNGEGCVEVSNSAGDHKAGSSNANERFAVRIDVAEPGQNGNESNSSQGNTISIPRRSPRVIKQCQHRELVDLEKGRGKKRCHESVDSDSESNKKRQRLEMRRAAYKARQSSMTENEETRSVHIRRKKIDLVPLIVVV